MQKLSIHDRPGVWFSLLCDSLAKQDFASAAQAKRELTRLGVDVSFRELPKSFTLVADAGKGVAHAR